MTGRPADVRRQLAALYAQIPDLDCRGRCWDGCTSFPVPRIEKRIIRRATGVDMGPKPTDPKTARCPLLTDLGQCGAYDVRPLICRLWGASVAMPCTYGCRPSADLLSIRQTYRLLGEAFRLSGQDSLARHMDVFESRGVSDELLEAQAPMIAAYTSGRLTEAQVIQWLKNLRDAC